jgi:hypothetical protein
MSGCKIPSGNSGGFFIDKGVLSLASEIILKRKPLRRKPTEKACLSLQ